MSTITGFLKSSPERDRDHENRPCSISIERPRHSWTTIRKQPDLPLLIRPEQEDKDQILTLDLVTQMLITREAIPHMDIACKQDIIQRCAEGLPPETKVAIIREMILRNQIEQMDVVVLDLPEDLKREIRSSGYTKLRGLLTHDWEDDSHPLFVHEYRIKSAISTFLNRYNVE